MRKAKVFFKSDLAGILIEDESGYHFQYEPEYLKKENAEPVSLTLPLSKGTYSDKVLLPFFDGLIPEGWLLEIAEKNWKLDTRDRMGILLVTCRDCIGAVSVEPVNEQK